MPASTYNISQLVLTKHLPCQPGHIMLINLYWRIPSNASEDIKCISTCVDHTHPMPASTQDIPKHVLTKPPPPWNSGSRMHLNFCWPNPFHAIEDTKYISAWVDQIHPMPAKTQNSPQHVLDKHIPCRWAHKTYLNLCWPNSPMLSPTENHQNISWINPSHASVDTKCILTKHLPC